MAHAGGREGLNPTPIDTARSLAAAYPTAMLPCPVCAVSLKAAHLDHHLAKVHGNAAAAATPWRGTDRRVIWTAITFVGVALVGMLAVVTSGSFVPGGALAMSMVAVECGFLALLTAAYLGAFKATIVLDGDTLVLRHSFGLGRLRATLPASIETGSLLRPRGGVHASDPHAGPVRDGWYLRVGDITIGCLQSTSFPTHWSPTGWRKAKPRMTRDVNVDQSTMVAIEYALAARGVLRLTGG